MALCMLFGHALIMQAQRTTAHGPYDLSANAPKETALSNWSVDAQRDSVEWRVFFRQAHRWLDPQFHNNYVVLDRMVETLQKAYNDSTLLHIDIQAWASPEGTFKLNTNLSIYRSEALANYILQHTNIPDSLISKFPGRVGWELLREMVAASDRPYKEKVLNILDNTPVWVYDKQGNIIDSRYRQLRNLDGGVTWNDMYARFYPDIRSAVAVQIYYKEPPKPILPIVVVKDDAQDLKTAEELNASTPKEEVPTETSAVAAVVPPCIPDTVIIRDTVYLQDCEKAKEQEALKSSDEALRSLEAQHISNSEGAVSEETRYSAPPPLRSRANLIYKATPQPEDLKALYAAQGGGAAVVAPILPNEPHWTRTVERDSVEWRVYFRQAHRWLDPKFRKNKDLLDRMVRTLNEAYSDSTLVHIDIQAWASPEGTLKHNTNLSIWRAQALTDYITTHTNIPDSIISQYPGKVGWGLLREMIEASDRPYKEKVLKILNEPFWTFDKKGNIIDSRYRKLRDLQGGWVWEDMLKRFYPDIRSSVAVYIHYKDSPYKPHAIVLNTSDLYIDVPDRWPSEIQNFGSAEEKAPATAALATVPCEPDTIFVHDTIYLCDTVERPPFYMDLRTNLIYDAMLVPNVGAEFHLAKNWTLMANVMYAWWHTDITHYYWRIYGGDLTIRKYFGKLAKEKPLQGHHLGAYAQLFTFDVEWGERGYMGGKPGGDIWDKHNYIFGLEYGFSLPVTKRLNIDFSIGAGYHGGTYHEYLPIDDHYVWQATKERHYWGVTKAEISLAWLIGHDNVNKEREKRKRKAETSSELQNFGTSEIQTEDLNSEGGAL